MNEAWSPYLAEVFGKKVAIAFVIGSEILLDRLDEDIRGISSLPKGSHIGELDASWISSSLPPQFLMRYDYDFLYALRKTIIKFRKAAPVVDIIQAHSVMEELALFLIQQEGISFFEICTEYEYNESEKEDNDEDNYDDDDYVGDYDFDYEWAFDIFDDMDIVTCFYSDWYLLDSEHSYHFDHWFEEQFYMDDDQST